MPSTCARCSRSLRRRCAAPRLAQGPLRPLSPLVGPPHETLICTHRPVTQSEKKKKKLEKGSQKARADFETKVQGTIQDFDDSLKQEMTAHQQQCNKVARLMSEYLKKVKASSTCQTPAAPLAALR